MKKLFLLFVGIILFSFISLTFVSALSVAVHIPEKYTEVFAGERFYFDVEIKYPENPQRKDLRLEYKIVDDTGEVLASSKVLKAVETQASFIDFILIPENAKSGRHYIKVNITDYEDLNEEVETSFNIVSNGLSEIKIYFFILLGVFILGVVLVIATIYIIHRKRYSRNI